MHGPLRNKRTGFTLVEMLITITIIGVLSAGVLAALQGAREAAKAAKTKATITKLHYVIMQRYDSYRTRRVPVGKGDITTFIYNHDGNSATGLPADEGVDLYSPYLFPSVPTSKISLINAQVRLMAIREIMRMEMPERWSEVTNNPLILKNRPSISDRYLRLFNTAGVAADTDLHASAECLYMIVMSIPEAAEQFSTTEIGDADDDGLPEFIDGWGHPIYFLRWPAGFLESNHATSDLQDGLTHDPFDSCNLTTCYATYPLIFSAGSDGKYDIFIQSDYYANALSSGFYNPNADFTLIGIDYRSGQPFNSEAGNSTAPEDLRHYDNIHNHILEVR